MIDFVVAADKLAQFQTSGQIADFLIEQGVKAVPEDGTRCAVAKYMQTMTGELDVFVGRGAIYFKAPTYTFYLELEEAEDTYANTPAMKRFIGRFDDGEFPELVDPNGVPLTDYDF